MSEDDSEQMSNEEAEVTYDPMFDLAERWGIKMTEAENFLVSVGYFNTDKYREIAEVFDPEPPKDAE